MKTKKVRALGIAAALGAAIAVSVVLVGGTHQTACACGGPAFYDIDAPLAGPERWLDDVTIADAFEARPRDELRFLAPFRASDSARVETLWRAAYGSWIEADSVIATEEPSVAPLDAALRAGDLPRAQRVAQRIVDQVLDEPATDADAHQAALRRAVELIELAPALGSIDRALVARVLATGDSAHEVPSGLPTLPTLPPALAAAVEVRRLPRDRAAAFVAAHPDHLRAASLRWVALQERLRTTIPDGWAQDTRKQVPDATWRALDDAHTRWLADYPSHPLADLVRLSRVRVAYFEGDSTRAWQLALALWPRHLSRSIGEARVLAVRGMIAEPPPNAARDPRIRSAMLTLRPPSRTEWDDLWRMAEDSLTRPWAVNLEERLLDAAARRAIAGERLPTRFPSRPARRSVLWGRLRLVALFAAGDTAAAEAQATTLGADTTAALVRARLALLRRQWTRAAREPLLGADARSYLVRVLLPDSALGTLLADARLDDSTRSSAAIALGAHAVTRDGWLAGAAVLARGGRAVPRELAPRWRRAAALAADTSLVGRLAYARWLAAERGSLFFGVDNAWYRSLGWRVRALRDTTDSAGVAHRRAPEPLSHDAEVDAIRAHLASTTEAYLALRAYGDWLARTEPRAATMRAERQRVAREADRVYNWLVNWDATNTSFWLEQLEQSPDARAIRRAGRS